jgi:D(-)-tartrate dehydratase
MRITEIRDSVVSIRSELRNAYISFSEMTVSIVAVLTDAGVTGYGFHSNGRYAQQGILRERLIPRILAAEPASLADGDNLDPHAVWRVMMSNEKPGGHGERSVAAGTLDMAVWDAVAKFEGRPLYRVLADRYNDGRADDDVYVYAAGGYYYPGKDHSALQEEMRGYLELGYTTVKMKIGGAPLHEDLSRIEAVLRTLPHGCDLAVDANGRFDRATALEYAAALAQYPLKWYEEPGDPLDFELNAAVAAESKVPVATGENLFSLADTRNLLRYGGMRRDRDYLQMDPALSYGTVEYLRILDMMRAHEWSPRRCIPHGGHQMALQIAAGLGLGGNESYPGIFQPFGGFADGVPVRGGRVSIPDAPGIGIEQKSALMDVYRELSR